MFFTFFMVLVHYNNPDLKVEDSFAVKVLICSPFNLIGIWEKQSIY